MVIESHGAVQDSQASLGRLFFLANPARARLAVREGGFERRPARICLNYEISFDLLVIGPMFEAQYLLEYLVWEGE